MPNAPGRAKHLITCIALSLALIQCACDPTDPVNMDSNDNTAPLERPGIWSKAFDAAKSGALSSVWGSGPDDVFMVGGQTNQGEIYHYDGSEWRAMRVPRVGLLVWVFGFSPIDVYAVGLDGAAVHYNGKRWTVLNTGTHASLWGVWGSSPTDIWIVGEDNIDSPVILHFDGDAFTRVDIPPNDRDATALFKVWGFADSVFAVGDNGLILQFKDGSWAQVPSGAAADDDFVSLWGPGAAPIVAVGGRATGRIGIFDGESWTTVKPDGVPGLNAVFMDDASTALCAGVRGFIGRIDAMTREVVEESSDESLDIHAVWGDGAGRYYAVGGRFTEPLSGLALVRTVDAPAGEPVPPLPDEGAECAVRSDCDDDDPCTADRCAEGFCSNDVLADCDNNLCFTQVCTEGDCERMPTDCDDGDPCTVDACFEGQCMNVPKNCDDGDPCTIDSCDNGVCLHLPLCASDEICMSGTCAPAPDCIVDGDCEDNQPCTTNSCVNQSCVFTPIVCNDDDPCTTDACAAGTCVFTSIDGCACESEADCVVGKDCVANLCTSVSGFDIEVGLGGGTIQPCNLGAFRRLHDGDELPLCQGFQADFLGDAFITCRIKGFGATDNLFVSTSLILLDSPCDMSTPCASDFFACLNGFCSPSNEFTNPVFSPIDLGGGVLQLVDVDILVIAENDVSDFTGRPALLHVSVFDATDTNRRATLDVPVTLFGRKHCTTGTCPAGMTCRNGYCDHP